MFDDFIFYLQCRSDSTAKDFLQTIYDVAGHCELYNVNPVIDVGIPIQLYNDYLKYEGGL